MSDRNYYSAASARELDRLAIEEHRIPGFKLMYRAGLVAFRVLTQEWPDCSELLVVCGAGNNGGDGFIIAGLAQDAGFRVRTYLAGDAGKIRGDAARALQFALDRQVELRDASSFAADSAELSAGDAVTVDALLGTGLAGAVRHPVDSIIQAINASGFPVLAVDIPSGLCSDTGKILGAAVEADVTVTFIGRKIGQIKNAGPALCGRLVFDDLGIPHDAYRKVSPVTL